MMKLILSLTLIWALSSTAGALNCSLQTCTNQQCTGTVSQTCSSETECITASIQGQIIGNPVMQNFTSCAQTSLCPARGSQTFSFNFGFANAVLSANCCTTDNCNTNVLPVPVAPTGNNLVCFTCGLFTSQCTSPVQCQGVEDSCIKATLMIGSISSPAFGCASKNLCAAASLNNLTSLNGVGVTGVSCCGSSLCNIAKTNTGYRIRLGMINLLLGLLMFTLC